MFKYKKHLFVGIIILILSIVGTIFVIQHTDSLAFSIENYSKDNHTIEVKVFNEKNELIFNETFPSDYSTGIYVPIDTPFVGSHQYVVTLDNNITKEKNVYLDSSDYFIIEIYDKIPNSSDGHLVLRSSSD
ncbi:hypothetical protein [Methanococcoides seepicolus]|jgi:hypothetical protein|uniref:Uncharacterized protein n=1 Tax=Methanococcoides seepicolus TaxID=2828780 RepID=A0A9E4ZKW7_9EURY|nr:hypothetical protein [Methanococcoides seepicolus]MCM1988024.1 hypothetical protein [Methanococcoides seepicolus]